MKHSLPLTDYKFSIGKIMKTIKIISIACIFIILTGCDDLLNNSSLNENPPHLITSQSLYTTLDGFQLGINGLYSKARDEHRSPVRTSMFMLGTDNKVPNWTSGGGFVQIGSQWGALNHPSDSYITTVFEWLYEVINAANTIINHAENKSDIDWSGGGFTPEENKNRIIGEAKAIRAWAYRHLTFGWGDVPLSLKESTGGTIRTDWERTPVAEVRQQMLLDLQFAEQHVPVRPEMAGQLTKGAIQHYLAELHLVLNEPDKALELADRAINTPEYELITERFGVKSDQPGVPFADMFYDGNTNYEEGNTESLWVFQYAYETTGGGNAPRRRGNHMGRFMDWVVDGIKPLQITYERGGRGKGYSAPTKWFMDSYEEQDHRFSNYILRTFFILKDAEGNAPQPADNLPPGFAYGDTLFLDWSEDLTALTNRRTNWPYSRKIEGTFPNNVTHNNDYDDRIYLRLADTYLLKAEAQYLLGDLGGAAETINIIRRRSNASEITASDVDLDFILDERSRELFLEEHRRWTLLRTGKWLERTRKYNNFGGENITERDLLFPIPQSVIDANLTKEMPQNPGF